MREVPHQSRQERLGHSLSINPIPGTATHNCGNSKPKVAPWGVKDLNPTVGTPASKTQIYLWKPMGEGTSLVVQWLRLHAPDARGPGPILSQGTRSHMLQLKILHASTKIEDPVCHNSEPVQPNKYFKKKNKKPMVPVSMRIIGYSHLRKSC